MYMLEHCKYAGLRSRWWFCHDDIETRPPSSPPSLHIFFMRWVVLLMNDRCSSCPLMRGFIWCGNPLSKANICGGCDYCDWCLPVISLYQYLPIANICHKALKLYHFPKSQIQINLAGKVKFKSIQLENINEYLVRIIKLGGWWWFEKILLESFAHSPARLCYLVNSVFGRRASEWFLMRLNKSGC